MKHILKYIAQFLKWVLLALFMGGIGGLLGTAFHYALHYVTDLRGENFWIIYLLPVGGVITYFIYKFFKLKDNKGTNELIDCVLTENSVNSKIAPAVFSASVVTHLFGGSGGREGAALQIGGSVASTIGKIFRLKDREKKVFIMSGMSAVFAGLFGTPLTAAIFCVEFIYVGKILSSAVLPCFLAAYTASTVSTSLGVHAETVKIDTFSFDYTNIWKIAIAAVAISLLGIFMCYGFKFINKLCAKIMPNKMIRIIVCAVIIVLATVLVGDQRYNGAGMDMALLATAGQADWFDFILKFSFTAITLAGGFRGGEIVPTFCIGATFGCFLGSLIGIDPAFCACLGLVGLFCCATNAPIASIILSVEMFGAGNIHIFALVCIVCFVLSGNASLYAAQKQKYSRLFFKTT